MKRILLTTSLLLSVLLSKAQNSAMTVTNASTCDADVTLYASFPYDGYGPCDLYSVTFRINAGVTINAPTYWVWQSIIPFSGVTTALTSAPAGGGAAPNFGSPGCFEWLYTRVVPAFAGSGAPYTGGGTPNDTWFSGGGACTSISILGTPCAVGTTPTPCTWVKSPITGDVVLTIH